MSGVVEGIGVAVSLLGLAETVRHICGETCAAKKLLGIIAGEMESFIGVMKVIREGERELAKDSVSTILDEKMSKLLQLLNDTKTHATKAKKMCRAVFLVKGGDLRDKVENNIRAINATVLALQMTQNHQLKKSLATFRKSSKKRHDELLREAKTAKREMQNLKAAVDSGSSAVADFADAIFSAADAAAAASSSSQDRDARIEELERTMLEMRAERARTEAERKEAENAKNTAKRDKVEAEAAFVDQILALLSAEAAERAKLPPECLCPILADIMSDPVHVDAGCRHTVSREGLRIWFDRNETTCPVCGTEVDSHDMVPNPTTRGLIEWTVSVSRGLIPKRPIRPQFVRSLHDVDDDYYGELNEEGEPHGIGALFDDEGIYVGEFRNGEGSGWGVQKFEGYFTLFASDVEALEKDLEGGRVMLRYEDGALLELETKDGVLQGQGVLRPSARALSKSCEVSDDGADECEGEVRDFLPEGHGKQRYKNGDTYEGQFRSGKPEGWGVYCTVKGNSYECASTFLDGSYFGPLNQDGKPNGHGPLKDEQGVYEGEFCNGNKEGRGTLQKSKGDVYEGEFRNGMEGGEGKMMFKNGDVYEGEFCDGEPQGRGAFFTAGGNVYSGECKVIKEDEVSAGYYVGTLNKNGQPHDLGFMKSANGESEGKWSDGVMEGKGKRTDSYGNVYDGAFQNGLMEGQGVYTWMDGDVYDGEFRDGEPRGKGTYRTSSGNIYTGECVSALFPCLYDSATGQYVGSLNEKKEPHGLGFVKSIRHGGFYEGEWTNGVLEGQGMLRQGPWEGSGEYKGEFRNGKKEGRGKLTLWEKAPIHIGCFKEDEETGEGVRFDADGKRAYRIIDGSVKEPVTLTEAKDIANRFAFPAPTTI